MKAFLRALVVPVSVLMCIVACPRGLSAQITLTQTFCTGTNACVTTYHNDNTRGGVNPNETTFTPSYLQQGHTFVATTYPTDGLIYAQPLYIKGLNGSNQKVGSCPSPAEMVFVATENNSVYAFEATPPASSAACWQINLNQTGETAIPYTSLPNNGQMTPTPCYNLIPQVGITGTPVIDVTVTPPILYVVTSHQKGAGSGATYFERLHAIDTTTGIEESWSPVDIGSKLPSSFNIIAENQRAGLALTHPTASPNLANIYVAWASNCDYEPTMGFYDGWIAGFQVNYTPPITGINLLGSFISEPTGAAHEGGIWMAGSAPAIDGSGNVYVAVANGDWTQLTKTSFGWGDSVLKLPSSPAPLRQSDPCSGSADRGQSEVIRECAPQACCSRFLVEVGACRMVASTIVPVVIRTPL